MILIEKYDLLIIFVVGEDKVIHGVTDYSYNKDSGLFVFVKNGYRSFVPVNNVKFFGRKFDWEENDD